MPFVVEVHMFERELSTATGLDDWTRRVCSMSHWPERGKPKKRSRLDDPPVDRSQLYHLDGL